MRLRPPVFILVLILLALALAPAGAHAGRIERGDLVPHAVVPESPDTLPAGYTVTPRQAARIAERSRLVRRERAKGPGLDREVTVPTYTSGIPPRWQVTYSRATVPQVEIHLHGRTGAQLEAWAGFQAGWTLARGYEPSVGRATFNSAWVIVPLFVLFLAPFFDPRRPFRLLHLDLLMLLGFGISHVFFNRGEVDVSAPLVYPFLLYLLGRLLFAGFRPRAGRGPLVPVVPLAALAVGLVLLVGFRVGLVMTDSDVIDVGYASVIGADRIVAGDELYTDNEIHGDTYGPIAYVAYVPFELLFPYGEGGDDKAAARAAALTFDLLTIIGLVLLGRRRRPGRAGLRLGLAMGFAWAAYPYSTYVLQSSTNDGLIAMLLVFSLLALGSAPARGGLLGLAAAAKFAPLGLAPLLAAGVGDRRPLAVARFAATLAGVLLLSVALYLPDGGIGEFWRATLDYQLFRDSPFSVWGQYDALEPLKLALTVAIAGLAAFVFFRPRRRELEQVAALAGAVVAGLQLVAEHWFYFYLVWLLPLALIALFGAYRSGPSAEAPREEDTSTPMRREAISPAGV